MAGKQRSASGAFLIELLIIIGVFAVCAAVAVSLIATADKEIRYSENLTASKHFAASIAETYVSGGDLSRLYEINEGRIVMQTEKASLTATITERTGENGVGYLDISVSDGQYTYTSFTCAKGGVVYER